VPNVMFHVVMSLIFVRCCCCCCCCCCDVVLSLLMMMLKTPSNICEASINQEYLAYLYELIDRISFVSRQRRESQPTPPPPSQQQQQQPTHDEESLRQRQRQLPSLSTTPPATKPSNYSGNHHNNNNKNKNNTTDQLRALSFVEPELEKLKWKVRRTDCFPSFHVMFWLSSAALLRSHRHHRLPSFHPSINAGDLSGA